MQIPSQLSILIDCDTLTGPGPSQGDVWEPTRALTVLVDRATKCFATAEGYKRQNQVTPNPAQGAARG